MGPIPFVMLFASETHVYLLSNEYAKRERRKGEAISLEIPTN
jgi:hypothetical protein